MTRFVLRPDLALAKVVVVVQWPKTETCTGTGVGGFF